MLSREAVINAYQIFLGREPENETVIESQRRYSSIKKLHKAMIKSAEYIRKQQLLLLSSEEVISAYQTILGRDPENETVIQEQRKCASVAQLHEGMYQSEEYKQQRSLSFYASPLTASRVLKDSYWL